MMRKLLRWGTPWVAAALLVFSGVVAAQQPLPPADPAPAATGPALPKPGESNAERTLTQPGNNAPFWRGVLGSGTQPGYSSLPGAEQGMLIQPFVQPELDWPLGYPLIMLLTFGTCIILYLHFKRSGWL